MSKTTIVAVAAGLAVVAGAAVADFVVPKLPIDPLGTGAKIARYAVLFGVGAGAVWVASKYIAKV